MIDSTNQINMTTFSESSGRQLSHGPAPDRSYDIKNLVFWVPTNQQTNQPKGFVAKCIKCHSGQPH